ncbi:MAG: hypothetical protein ACI4UW_09240, partial [Muribaculaceae bacterium]
SAFDLRKFWINLAASQHSIKINFVLCFRFAQILDKFGGISAKHQNKFCALLSICTNFSYFCRLIAECENCDRFYY